MTAIERAVQYLLVQIPFPFRAIIRLGSDRTVLEQSI